MSEYATLLDLKNNVFPGDSAIADVAEVLVEENEGLQDVSWQAGNLLTGAVSFKREAMPKSQIRKINAGVVSSISKTTAHVDTCIEIASRSVVDMKVLRFAPNANKFLLNESKPHIAILGEDVMASMFYGSDEAGLRGFAARYGKKNGENSRQIIDFEGAGTKFASAFIVKWDPEEVTGIYPKHATAGLEMVPLVNMLVPQADDPSKTFRAHVTDYSWDFGLKVRDHRFVSRLCNIDMEAIAKDEAARQRLFELLIIAKNRVYHVTQGRVVLYVSPDLYSMLEVAAFNKSNLSLGYKDIASDTRILTFSGIPIRRNDCQLEPEKKVA